MSEVALPKSIDDSLGRGLARQLFRQVQALDVHVKLRDLRLGAIDTERERKRACQKLLTIFAKVKIDAIVTPQHYDLRIAYLRAEVIEGQEVVSVYLHWTDMHPVTFGILPTLRIPVKSHKLVSISIHALQRMIQRGDLRKVEDLIAMIGLAANWMVVANMVLHDGAFMVPCTSGMICCDTVLPQTNRRARFAGTKASLVTTFIGLDQMSDATRARWQRMVDHGGLTNIPRAVRKSDFKEFYDIFAVMAEEGRLWEQRKLAD